MAPNKSTETLLDHWSQFAIAQVRIGHDPLVRLEEHLGQALAAHLLDQHVEARGRTGGDLVDGQLWAEQVVLLFIGRGQRQRRAHDVAIGTEAAEEFFIGK